VAVTLRAERSEVRRLKGELKEANDLIARSESSAGRASDLGGQLHDLQGRLEQRGGQLAQADACVVELVRGDDCYHLGFRRVRVKCSDVAFQPPQEARVAGLEGEDARTMYMEEAEAAEVLRAYARPPTVPQPSLLARCAMCYNPSHIGTPCYITTPVTSVTLQPQSHP
jgi:hypothetical protein